MRIGATLLALAAVPFAPRLVAQAPQTGDVAGVASTDGKPAAGVRVSLTDAAGTVIGTSVTEADGTFRVAGVRPGNYDVGCEDAAHGRTGSRRVRVAAGGVTPAEIELFL